MILTLLYRSMIFPFLVDFNQLFLSKIMSNFLSTVKACKVLFDEDKGPRRAY